MKKLTAIVMSCFALGASPLEANAQDAAAEKPAEVRDCSGYFFYSASNNATRIYDFHYAFLFSRVLEGDQKAAELFNKYSRIMATEGFSYSQDMHWIKKGLISEGFVSIYNRAWNEVFSFYRETSSNKTIGEVVDKANKAAKELSR